MSLASQRNRNVDEFGSNNGLPKSDAKPVVEGSEKKHVSRSKIPRNVPIDFFGNLVETLLKSYQGQHYKTDTDDNSFFFPFARYLKEGVEIKNTDTGEFYFVEEMIMNNEDRDMDGHHVRLRCDGSPPLETHRLRLSDSQGQNVRFIESYPDGDAQGDLLNRDGRLEESSMPWADTISFQVFLTEPAKTTGGASGGGIRAAAPQFREEFELVKGTGHYVQVYSHHLEHHVRFDCWSQTNVGATMLRRWFRVFMHHYAWLFKYNGYNNARLEGMTVPARATRWRTDIVAKSAAYFFTSQDNWIENLGQIRDISYEVKLPVSKDQIEKEPQSIQSESILITGRKP